MVSVLTGRHLGYSENLSYSQHGDLVAAAERLGYSGLWTNENRQRDAFITCTVWGAQSSHIAVGIGVSPIGMRTPHAIALSSLSVQDATNNRFILGIGSGQRRSALNQWSNDTGPSLAATREYVEVLSALFRGGPVHYQGSTLSISGDSIDISPRPAPPPIIVGALGEQMVKVAARYADGMMLNWASDERIASARVTVAEQAANRTDGVTALITGYIRVSVSDDVLAARRAVAIQLIGYLGSPAYRAQFVAMGFPEEVAAIEAALPNGLNAAIDATSDEFLRAVCLWGTAEMVQKNYDRVAGRLDLAVVRCVPVTPTIADVLSIAEALAPL